MLDLSFLKGKKLAVFGLGIAGKSIVNALTSSGVETYVWDDNEKSVADLSDAKNLIKQHYNEMPWAEIDYLVLSPGVPLYFPAPHPVVEVAKKNDVNIICDIELLYLSNPDSLYIGITGTNGKSTTTSLLYEALKENGKKVEMGGNIGVPVGDLSNLGTDGIYVLELSSYQLDLLDKAKINIAVLLNAKCDVGRQTNM